MKDEAKIPLTIEHVSASSYHEKPSTQPPPKPPSSGVVLTEVNSKKGRVDVFFHNNSSSKVRVKVGQVSLRHVLWRLIPRLPRAYLAVLLVFGVITMLPVFHVFSKWQSLQDQQEEERIILSNIMWVPDIILNLIFFVIGCTYISCFFLMS